MSQFGRGPFLGLNARGPLCYHQICLVHYLKHYHLLNFSDLEDKGAVTVSLRNKTTSMSKDADPEKQHQVIKDIIPNQKDFIVAYSTVPSK